MAIELLDPFETVVRTAIISNVDYIVTNNYQTIEAFNRIKETKMEKPKLYKTKQSLAALNLEMFEKRTMFVTTDYQDLVLVTAAARKRLPVIVIFLQSLEIALNRRNDGIFVIPESNQELLDSIIQCFRICEDNRVLLPGVINIDRIIRQEVSVPSEKTIASFLSSIRLPHAPKKGFPTIPNTSEQLHLAMVNAKKIIEKMDEKWSKKFHRHVSMLEKYPENYDNPDYVFVMSGYDSGTAKAFIAQKDEENKIGLIRINFLSPFPDIKDALTGVKKLAVIDKGFSGYSMLHTEVKSHCPSSYVCLFILEKVPAQKDFEEILNRLEKQEEEERFWVQ